MPTVKQRIAKGEKQNRITRGITLNKEVWERSGNILAGVGLSRSRFIELILREVVRSEKVSFAEITGELFETVAEAAVKKAIHKQTKG